MLLFLFLLVFLHNFRADIVEVGDSRLRRAHLLHLGRLSFQGSGALDFGHGELRVDFRDVWVAGELRLVGGGKLSSFQLFPVDVFEEGVGFEVGGTEFAAAESQLWILDGE